MAGTPDNQPGRRNLLARWASAIANQQKLLEKLHANGVNKIVEDVIPEVKFPEKISVGLDLVSPDPTWKIAAMAHPNPSKLILLITRTEQTGRYDVSSSIQMNYLEDGTLSITGEKKEFEEKIGDRIDEAGRPLKDALENAKKNPMVGRMGWLSGSF